MQKPLAESDPYEFYNVLSAKLESLAIQTESDELENGQNDYFKASRLSLPKTTSGWYSDSDTSHYTSDLNHTLSKDGSRIGSQELRKV